MNEVNEQQVVAALQAVGVRAGDGLLVHSALQYLGRPTGGVGMYYNALVSVLEGQKTRLALATIAVPAFNFAFARGEPYDPQVTSSVGMGAFSEYIRRLAGARRTLHPMQSLAVIGRHAEDLASRDTPSAFDPGSAFERMLELDFKLLLLGADIQAVSMLHYSEQRARVPYRYWKEFSGPVKTDQGWERRTCRMYVRDLDIDPQIEMHAVQARLQAGGLWNETRVNYGKISLCRLADFVAVADELLAADPWALVRKVKGKKLDG